MFSWLFAVNQPRWIPDRFLSDQLSSNMKRMIHGRQHPKILIQHTNSIDKNMKSSIESTMSLKTLFVKNMSSKTQKLWVHGALVLPVTSRFVIGPAPNHFRSSSWDCFVFYPWHKPAIAMGTPHGIWKAPFLCYVIDVVDLQLVQFFHVSESIDHSLNFMKSSVFVGWRNGSTRAVVL